MTQMLLQHCFSIFKNSLLGAEFLWTNKSTPFMVLRRLIVGFTSVRQWAVRRVLGQFPRLWFLSLMKVNGFHVCLSQLITGECMWKRGKSLCTLRGFSWYWNDSFYLHIFLCICLNDTKTTYCSSTSQFEMSSFWFSFPMKLLFTFEISFLHHVSKLCSGFRIANCVVCSEFRMHIWTSVKTT